MLTASTLLSFFIPIHTTGLNKEHSLSVIDLWVDVCSCAAQRRRQKLTVLTSSAPFVGYKPLDVASQRIHMNNYTESNDWHFIYPNQHVSLRTAEQNSTSRSGRSSATCLWCRVSSLGGWLKTRSAAPPLAPGLITFSRWTLQALPGIGSVCVILCMSKQITVSSAKVGGAKHTVWGMMEPTGKEPCFPHKTPFCFCGIWFQTYSIEIVFVLVFNTTLPVTEH